MSPADSREFGLRPGAKRARPFWSRGGCWSCRKRAHDRVERRLTLEADARPIGQREISALQFGVIGETAEGAEYAGIGFRAAETETAGDGERHLIAAVGEQRTARPAVTLGHLDGASVLHDAVGLGRIDLDDVVAIRTKPAKTNEIFHVLRRKKIFAGRERRIIIAGNLREQGKIERIAWLFEPAQPEGC